MSIRIKCLICNVDFPKVVLNIDDERNAFVNTMQAIAEVSRIRAITLSIRFVCHARGEHGDAREMRRHEYWLCEKCTHEALDTIKCPFRGCKCAEYILT